MVKNPNYPDGGNKCGDSTGGGYRDGDSVGTFAVKIINKVKMDNDSFYPIMLLVFGVFIFASTYSLKGNGYLAVYIAGLVIGNSRLCINAPP